MRVCLTVQREWRKIELTFVYGAHHLASDRLNRRAAWRGGCRIWLLVPREPLKERVERKTKKFMKQEAVRTPSGRRSSLFSERKVIYLAERKVNRIVKPALLGDAPAKRQDQPLSRAADDAAFVGKISGPLPKVARQKKAAKTAAEQTMKAAEEAPQKKEAKGKRAPRGGQNGEARRKTEKNAQKQ